MARKVDAKTYAKNVVRSAGYIATDTIKGVNPELTTFITDGVKATKDMYNGIKDFKSGRSSFVDKILGENGKKQLKDIKRNALEDLRTGQFYNPKREDQNTDKLASMMGLSFDFDDVNFDVDDEDVNSTSSSDADTTKAVMTIGDKIAFAQQSSTAQSTSKITGVSSRNARASMMHNERLFGQVNNSLGIINASIMNLHNDLATPLNNHITNSTVFYNVATEQLAKQTTYLENINKLLTDRFAPIPSSGFGKSKNFTNNNWNTVMGSSGIPNIGAWKNIAVKRSLESTGIDMIAGMLDPEMVQLMLQQASGSPIAMIMTEVLKDKLQRGATGKALNRTNRMLRNGLMTSAVKIHNYNKANRGKGIFGKLASMLDIVPDEKTKVDFGKYNKGRADWTGKDSKALQEVIPTQLAAILSAITGEDAKVFDYDTGRFVTASRAIRDFNINRKKNISSATYDMKNEIIEDFISADKKFMKEHKINAPAYTTNSRATRNLSKDFDTLMHLLTISNVDVSREFTKKGDIIKYCTKRGWFRDGILNRSSISAIDTSVFKNNGSSGSFMNSIYSSRMVDNDFLSNANAMGTFGNVSNGSGLVAAGKNNISSSFINSIDDKGHNVFFYLQDFYKQLRIIANNVYRGGKNRKFTGTSSFDGEIPIDKRMLAENQRRFKSRERVQAAITPIYTSGLSDQYTDSEGRQEWNPTANNGRGAYQTATSRASREREEKSSPLSRSIDKVTDFFDNLFFGKTAENVKKKIDDNGGIVKILTNLPEEISRYTQEAMDKIKKWTSEKWTQFRESDFGKDFFGASKQMIKNHFVKTKNYAKEHAAETYEAVVGKKPSWAADMTGAYKGGQVKKSGMASVSEGEIIIPAKYNPNYTGHMGDQARKMIEKSNYHKWLKDGGSKDRFFGFFSRGGRVKDIDEKDHYGYNELNDIPQTKLSIATKHRIRELRSQGKSYKDISYELQVNLNQVKQVAQKQYQENDNRKYVKEKVSDVYSKAKNSKAGQKVGETFENINDKINLMFGEGTTEELKSSIKDYLPKNAASGAMGAIIGGALTGSGLGVLGGMVVGTGISVINNSSKLTEALFGKQDERGNWSGGKLSANVSNFIKKKLPKTAQAGTLGAILGTLGLAPGGIFGGLVLGAGLELVSGTNTFQDIMFGKPDIHNERHGGLVGSLKTQVVNPLINFVQDGISHIKDWFKDNVFDPVKGLFNPLKDWVKGFATKKFDKIVDDVKATVKRTVGEKISAVIKPTAKVVGKVGKSALGKAKWVAERPGAMLKDLAGGIEKHNIRMGYSSKSAKERMAMEGQSMGGMGHVGNLLRRIPGVGNKIKTGTLRNSAYTRWAAEHSDDDILELAKFTNGANDLKRSNISERQSLADVITASFIDGGVNNPAEVKALKNLFNTDAVRKNNDFTDVINNIDTLDSNIMGSDTKDLIKRQISKVQNRISKNNENISNYNANRETFFKNKMGLASEDIEWFRKKYGHQIKLDAAGIKDIQNNKTLAGIDKAKSSDNEKRVLEAQEQASPIDKKRNSFLETIVNILSGMAAKVGVDPKDLKNKQNNEIAPKNAAAAAVESALPTKGKESNFNAAKPAVGTRTSQVIDGHVVETIVDDKGETHLDESDASTFAYIKDSKEDREKRNAYYDHMVSGKFFEKFKGIFDTDKKNKDNPSFFDKIKGFFGGDDDNSFIGKIAKFIKGKGGLASILGIGALIAAVHRIGEKAGGTDTDSGMNNEKDPEERKKEVENMGFFSKVKLGFDSLENRARNRKTTTYNPDDYVTPYMSDRFNHNMVKNAVLSFNPKYAKAAGNVINHTVGMTPWIGKGASAIMRAPGAIGDMAAKSVIKNADLTDIITDKAVLKSIQRHNAKIGLDPNNLSLASRLKTMDVDPDDFVKANMSFTNTTFGSKVTEAMTKLTSRAASTKVGQHVAKGIDAAKNVGGKVADVMGKAKSKSGNLFGKVTDKLKDTKAGSVAMEAIEKLKGIISKVFSIIAEKFGLNSATSQIDEVAEEAAGQIAKKGGTKLASSLSKMIIWIQIAVIANAVIEGMQSAKAKTILGILDKPTIGQRILAAACNGLNEAIPGIGGLIPTEVLFSIVYTALETLGTNMGKLSDQRAEAKAIVAKYNEENGTTYNIEEYIHNVMGEYTIQQKIGKGIKDTGKAIANGAKNVWKSTKNILFGDDDKRPEDIGSKTMSIVDSNYRKLNNRASLPPASTYAAATSGEYPIRPSTAASTYAASAGGASGVHTTQKGNFSKFGCTTIDQNGCGPAAASTVLKSYGKNIGINSAAKYAEAGGYVAGSSGIGTKASYFGDILGANGIQTDYMSSQSEIDSAVNSGNPTILLGQDKSNNSKSRSPFGPNPHYVVARGKDKNGNVIVDDPELKGTAVYNKSILKKTKLGVATGGASGVEGILDKFTTGVFGKISESLGKDSVAGKIFGTIFGTGKKDEGPNSTEDGYSYGGENGQYGTVTYGSSPFPILTSPPSANDKYIKLYNNKSNGGISTCISGALQGSRSNPIPDPVCNVLSNCVGWASARFNHIYNLLTNTDGLHFPNFNVNAGKFIDQAKASGLQVGMTPQAGAIMVWDKPGKAGHVAIVERVDSAEQVYTSESGYASKKFWNQTRKKGTDGNWGLSGGKFLGFIYNPAVTQLTAKSQTGSSGEKMDPSQRHSTIFKWLTNNGFSKMAASGIMGCWEAESRNTADRVEGDYVKSYPGADKVLKDKNSISTYTTSELFPMYKKKGMSINENGYKAPDGYYYPGIGLAQWTGARARNLIEYANKKGMNHRSIETQLSFFKNDPHELPARKDLINGLNSATSPEDAATLFLDKFEMNGSNKGQWHLTKDGSKQNTVRRNNARKIFNTLGADSISASGSGLIDPVGRGSAIDSNRNIPVEYDFTGNRSKLNSKRVTKYKGSGTDLIDTPTSVTFGESSDKKIDTIVLCLKQIASNTAYNSAIPTLVDIMKQSIGVMSTLNNSSNSTTESDTMANINNEIDRMKNRLEAVATAL